MLTCLCFSLNSCLCWNISRFPAYLENEPTQGPGGLTWAVPTPYLRDRCTSGATTPCFSQTACLTNSGDLPGLHRPRLAASALKSHACNAPCWTLPLPQGAEPVPDDASTARGTVGPPPRSSPSPPWSERCGKALGHSLGRSEPGADNFKDIGKRLKEGGRVPEHLH